MRKPTEWHQMLPNESKSHMIRHQISVIKIIKTKQTTPLKNLHRLKINQNQNSKADGDVITPNRKFCQDKCETPVPGSVNGSCIMLDKQSLAPTNVNKGNNTMSIEDSKTIKIMQNMETVLQNVV